MRLLISGLLSLLLTATVMVNGATASAGHNPGLARYHEAVNHYQQGRHQDALEAYRDSAHWGNKLSQFNLGTMYYNGVSVARDPARAWAWIKLSAERDYPQLVAAEEEIWRELDARERTRAERIYATELLPDYGDEVALPRMRHYVDRRYSAATGSRLGGAAASNPLIVQPREGVQSSGDVYYQSEDWRIERWLEQEKAWFEAMMEAGEPVAQFEDK